MVTAMIGHDRKARVYTLDMSGHAGYAERGKDIVCAGCSTLAYAAYSTLVGFADCGHCTLDEARTGADAEFGITATAAEGVSDALVMTIFSVLARGLEALAQEYPEHVSLQLHDA